MLQVERGNTEDSIQRPVNRLYFIKLINLAVNLVERVDFSDSRVALLWAGL